MSSSKGPSLNIGLLNIDINVAGSTSKDIGSPTGNNITPIYSIGSGEFSSRQAHLKSDDDTEIPPPPSDESNGSFNSSSFAGSPVIKRRNANASAADVVGSRPSAMKMTKVYDDCLDLDADDDALDNHPVQKYREHERERDRSHTNLAMGSQSQGTSISGSPERSHYFDRPSSSGNLVASYGKKITPTSAKTTPTNATAVPAPAVSPGNSGKLATSAGSPSKSSFIGNISIPGMGNSFIGSIASLVTPGTSKTGSGWHTPTPDNNGSGNSVGSITPTRPRSSTKEWIADTMPSLKKMSDGHAEPVSLASFLYNYLATLMQRSGKNGGSSKNLLSNVDVTPAMIHSFEEVILENFGKFPDEVNVIRVLNTFGWTGVAFDADAAEEKVQNSYTGGAVLDIEKIRQALGTLYLLSTSETVEASTESYWVEELQQYRRFVLDDDATLKCFCPTILFDHLLNPPIDDGDYYDKNEGEFGSISCLSRQDSNPYKELSFQKDNSYTMNNRDQNYSFSAISHSFSHEQGSVGSAVRHGSSGSPDQRTQEKVPGSYSKNDSEDSTPDMRREISGGVSSVTNKMLESSISLKSMMPPPPLQDIQMAVYSTVFNGACLHVDISGFTKLSGKYCREGVDGLDKLHQITNGLLAHLVQIVIYHSGDVISFAGDALICVFRVTTETLKSVNLNNKRKKAVDDLQLSCARALKCCSALRDYEDNDLTVHIGLSCGEMCFTTLGGYQGRWTYLLNGKCMHELESCLDDAQSKQVVITAACYDLLRGSLGKLIASIGAKQLASGNYLFETLFLNASFSPPSSRLLCLPCSDNITSTIKSFIPQTVTGAVETGSYSSMAELREVTTMFLSLDSYTAELYANPASLQSFFLICQEAMHDTGGYMRQFLIDDKGCVLIVMWGVPSFSYQNNTARAVDCAVMIDERAGAIAHRCSIGITTGSVYCGNIGSVVRRDYVGIGETVNIAARLMVKAAGRVLVDAGTYARLPEAGQCHLMAVESMILKGVGALVPYAVADCHAMPRISVSDEDMVQKDGGFLLRTDLLFKLRSQLGKIAEDAGFVQYSPRHDEVVLAGPRYTYNNSDRAPVHNSEALSFEEHQVTGGTLGMIAEDVSEGPMCLSREPSARGFLSMSRSNLNNSFRGDDDLRREVEQYCRRFIDMPVPMNANVSFTVVRGPPGCGKSTAARHFLQQANRFNIQTLTFSARTGGNLQPYGIITKILAQLIGRKMLQTAFKARFVLTHMIKMVDVNIDNAEAMTKAERLCQMMADKQKTAGFFEKVDLCGNTIQKLLALVLSNRAVAIVIENAHFIDELSWQQIRFLMDADTCLAVLLTIRDSHYCHANGNISKARRISDTTNKVSRLMGFNAPTGSANSPSRPQQRKSISALISSLSGKIRSSTVSQDSDSGKSSFKMPMLPSPSAAFGSSSSARAFGVRSITSDAYQSILNSSQCEVVDMGPLSLEDVKNLLLRMMPSKDITEELVIYLFEVSVGSPFWCKAIAGYILETGFEAFNDVVVNKSKYTKKRALDAIVISRFEKLPSAQQVFIKHASVIGDEFSSDQLIAIIPPVLKNKHMNVELMKLVDAGFLFLIDDGTFTSFSFQNELIRDVLYDLMPPTENARIHHALALHIEMTNQNELEPHFASLSYHFAKSRRGRNDAFKYTTKAAGQAASRGAYAEGIVFANSAYNMILSSLEARCLKHVVNKALSDMDTPKSMFSRLFAGQPSAKERAAQAQEKEQKQAYLDLKRDLEATIEELNRVTNEEDVDEAASPSQRDAAKHNSSPSQKDREGLSRGSSYKEDKDKDNTHDVGSASLSYVEQLHAIEEACKRVNSVKACSSAKDATGLTGFLSTTSGSQKNASMSVNMGDELDLSFTPPPSSKSRSSSLNNQTADIITGIIASAGLFGESVKASVKKSSPQSSSKSAASHSSLKISAAVSSLKEKPGSVKAKPALVINVVSSPVSASSPFVGSPIASSGVQQTAKVKPAGTVGSDHDSPSSQSSPNSTGCVIM